MENLSGRTAFITGGGNGIGLGIARALAGHGVNLALADVDDQGLEAAKAELCETTKVEIFHLDVRDRAAFAQVADRAEASVGPVSLLFNNAGVAGGGPANRLSYDVWDWGVGINLGGVFNGIHTFLPRMTGRSGGGHIVNTASLAGLVGLTSGLLYSATKFAVVGMSEALRHELAPLEIGVSVLCPGPVATDIHSRSEGLIPANPLLTAEDQAAVHARNVQMRALLGGGAGPEQVGSMVLEAICQNQLFILTDQTGLEAVQARHQEIVSAMRLRPDPGSDNFLLEMAKAAHAANS